MSSSSEVSIEHAGRTVAAGLVAFDIKWSGGVSDADGALWSVVIQNPLGEAVRLGYQRDHGVFCEQFVEDLSSGERITLAEDAELRQQEVTARFPAQYVGAAVEWPTWTAEVSGGGVRACRAVAL